MGASVSFAFAPLHATTTSTPQELLRTAVAAQLPKNVRIEVEKFYTREKVPDTASIVGISPEPPLGAVSFTFLWNEKGVAHQAFGHAVVKAFAKVAVAKYAIRPGESFTSENISFEERELSAYRNSGYYDNWDRLSQMHCNGFVAGGSVVGYSQAQLPFDVTQGESVDLIVESGALRITAKVRALENGRVNRWIRIENPSSRKILQARVIAPGVVKLR